MGEQTTLQESHGKIRPPITLGNAVKSRKRKFFGMLFALSMVLGNAYPSLADVSGFTPIDAPGGFGAIAQGINDAGQIVGNYEDGNFTTHGFLLDKGNFSTIDVPGAAFTQVFGINDAGQIVGFYSNARTTPVLSRNVQRNIIVFQQTPAPDMAINLLNQPISGNSFDSIVP